MNGGYNWENGMSNRAMAAYDAGLMPSAAAAAALNKRFGWHVNGAWVRDTFAAAEWHHTSGRFNITKFYRVADLVAEIEAAGEKFGELASAFAERVAARKSAAPIVADVSITEWQRVFEGHRLVNRMHHVECKAVECRNCGATMIDIAGYGRKSRKNCVVSPCPAGTVATRTFEMDEAEAAARAKQAAEAAAVQRRREFAAKLVAQRDCSVRVIRHSTRHQLNAKFIGLGLRRLRDSESVRTNLVAAVIGGELSFAEAVEVAKMYVADNARSREVAA